MSENFKKGLDLTKEAPRSPRIRIGNFVQLSRTIDKCRALLWGNIGEYDYDCELDKTLFDWKGITGDALKAYIAEGHSDMEIFEWVRANGIPKSDFEIMKWSGIAQGNKYQDDPEGKEWLKKQIERLHIPEDSTLFDYLDADDKASFKKI